MKKTFQVNINGKIYHIDEDAYTLLQNYLAQLRDAFPGDEGIEIVNDIEFRISEHFDQRLAGGASVIVIDDVNRVISIMAAPTRLPMKPALSRMPPSPPVHPAPNPSVPKRHPWPTEPHRPRFIKSFSATSVIKCSAES